MATVFYQLSVNKFICPVLLNGKRQLPSDFTQATYILAENNGNILAELTLNNGVVADNEKKEFIITVPDTVIPDNMKGYLTHQFVLHNSVGEKLPPVFKERGKIVDVIASS